MALIRFSSAPWANPSVPDHITLWGLVLPIRQGLDLWANLRPVQTPRGHPSPLAEKSVADIDMMFLREKAGRVLRCWRPRARAAPA